MVPEKEELSEKEELVRVRPWPAVKEVPVFWSVAHPGGTVVRHRVFPGDRETVQIAATYAALDLLRRIASGLPER